MHESSDIRRTSRRAVYVYDVGPIAEGLTFQISYHPVNLVNLLVAAYHVVLGDEDDVRVAQLGDIALPTTALTDFCPFV